VKPDIEKYPEYKSLREYTEWISRVHATMRNHGCGEVLDPYYVPNSMDMNECKYWAKKQAFAYDMLVQKVEFPIGREIVDGHKVHGDAQTVFYQLSIQAQASTEALVVNQGVMRRLYAEQLILKGVNLQWNTSFELIR